MPHVRLATREDEPHLMDLCRALHAENGIVAMDENMVRAMLSRAFDRKGGIIGVIGEKAKPLEGMIYILISNLWYTSDHHLEELCSFVHPDYRRGGHADALIAFAKRCSDDMTRSMGKPVPLIIGIFTNSRIAGKVRLYRRQLGWPSGAVFVYNSPWKTDVEESESEFWRAPFREMRGGRRHRKKSENGAHAK
jgi:GNAT superfamily N-acetyltransferase